MNGERFFFWAEIVAQEKKEKTRTMTFVFASKPSQIVVTRE
jgi:hypothetical protein